MSNPPNPLSRFRTYSYHHFLLVTGGMNTAQAVSNQSDVSVFNRITGEETTNERFAVRKLTTDAQGGYVVLVDGMKDIQFYINSAKWETIIAPNGSSGGQKTADTIEVEGQIIITEPYGISFLKILTNAARDLESDPSGLIFILKTVFVGHRDDGSQSIISNVRPFMFTMTDVRAIMDTGGATYTVDIVGVNNGTAKLPQISRVADSINLEIKGTPSVAAALKDLENEINNRYTTFKKQFGIQLQESGSPLELARDFREVTYEIVADPAYSNSEYVVGDNLPVNASGGPQTKQITTGMAATVESAIRAVMDSCTQVQKDSSSKNKEGEKFIYKIVSTIVPDPVKDTFKVQYSVHRYQMITQRAGVPLKPKEGEFIEFEYIFTGKNTEVLQFDIKMDMGLSFFYTLATADSIQQTQSQATSGMSQSHVGGPQSTTQSADPQVTDPKKQKRKSRTPLFLGTTISDPRVRNKANPVDSATFDALLTRHAAFENVEARMTIAGNPQLLDETTPQPDEAESGETEPAQPGTTGLSRMFKTPSMVKVNVKYPTDNTLTSVRDFWYQGFYNIYAITQNFEEGLFTQNVHLFSIPQSDGTEEKLAVAKAKKAKADVDTTNPTTKTGNGETTPPPTQENL